MGGPACEEVSKKALSEKKKPPSRSNPQKNDQTWKEMGGKGVGVPGGAESLKRTSMPVQKRKVGKERTVPRAGVTGQTGRSLGGV